MKTFELLPEYRILLQAQKEHLSECEALLKLLDEYENDKSKNSGFVNPLPNNDDLPFIDEDSNPLTRKVSHGSEVHSKHNELLTGLFCSIQS